MPRRKPASDSSTNLRRSIAAGAARLMAEEGIDDFGQAKRKAARQIGAGQSDALPSNAEVEVELRSFMAIFQEEEQPERLHELRQVALEVMEFFADFNPHLTGSVLDGTAGRFAQVDIELFADSSKDVEIFLLSRGVTYTPADMRSHAAESRLTLDWDGVPIAVSIFPPLAQRQNRKNHARAGIASVANLIKATP